MKDPDEEIAGNIIEKFRAKNLLSETKLSKLKTDLSTGKLTPDDWKLLFETDRPETSEDTSHES